MNYAGDVTPRDAFEAIATDSAAALVDVRTPAEVTFVGAAALDGVGKAVVTIPWFPEMSQDQLVNALEAAGIDRDDPVYFLCRSGARSLNAAVLATHGGYRRAYNVSGGFEGPLDGSGHRGTVAGWKVDGLRWRQQ